MLLAEVDNVYVLILHNLCLSLYISHCSAEQSWVQMEINIQFPLSPEGGTAFKPPSFGLQVPNYVLKRCVQGLLLDLQLIKNYCELLNRERGWEKVRPIAGGAKYRGRQKA